MFVMPARDRVEQRILCDKRGAAVERPFWVIVLSSSAAFARRSPVYTVSTCGDGCITWSIEFTLTAVVKGQCGRAFLP